MLIWIVEKVTSAKTSRDFPPKELGIIPLKKIGGLRYLMEIWRNQLKFIIMISVIPTPFESLIENHLALVPITNEDQLSLELADVDITTGAIRIANCREFLQLNNSFLPDHIFKIGQDQLDVLYSALSAYTPSTPKKYISVLKITFGLKETVVGSGNFEMYPLFRPLILEWSEYVANSNNHLYVPKDGVMTQTYDFDKVSGRVNVINTAQKDEYVQNYMTHIRIKHDDTENFARFRQGVDVKFIIIPFQTIYTLMNENNNIFFNLYNSIQKITHQEVNFIKHAILIDSLKNNPPVTGAFTGKYANRSHLCPPCNGVNFGFDLA